MKYLKLWEKFNQDVFNEWFGDSKIVDENDKPLVVYHGSQEEFNSFNPSPMTGGVYFTDSLDHAQDYGHNIYIKYI